LARRPDETFKHAKRLKTPKYSTNTGVASSVNKGEVCRGTRIEPARFALLATPSHLITEDGNGA
jgi:hypothetical protein